MKKLLITLFLTLSVLFSFGQQDCANAIPLTPGTQQCGTNDYLDPDGDFPDDNSAPNNPCYDYYNDGEYWFSYVGTGGSLQLDVSALSATYSGIYVLDDCPSSSPNCIADHSSSSSADYSVTTPDLSVGTTYYIVIANWGIPNFTDFCLDATESVPPTALPMVDGGNTIGCSGIFTDPEGYSDYTDNSNTISHTFCSGTGEALQFVFSAFTTENNKDILEIFDGPDNTSTSLGVFDDVGSPGTITSTGTCLTFEWTTDGGGVFEGWVANISCIPMPPPNDLCANATLLSCGTTDLAGSTNSSTNIADPQVCASNYGVWYTFVGDGIENIISSSADFDHEMVITYGSCGSLTTVICDDGSTGDETHTFTPTLGTTYFVYIANYSTSSTITGDFTISRECLCAPVFTLLNGANNCPTGTQYFINVDITSLGTAATVSVTNDGGAPSITNISTLGIQTIGPFVANTTVNVVVENEADNACTDNANWTTPTTCPPTNDECINAISLTVNPDYSCAVVTASTTVNSTNSGIAACAGSGADDDVWFSFVATHTSHKTSLLNVTGSSTDMVHEIFTGPCVSLTSIGCSDADASIWTGFTIGNTYWVRVYTYYTTGTASFEICVGSPPPPPTNDECVNALVCTVNADELCGIVTAGYTTSATTSGEATACSGTPNDDVWFSFVAVTTVHGVDILNIVGTVTDMYHAVYEGPCNSLTELVCNDGNSTDLGGLTPGQTYYVRVYTYSSTVGSTVDFDVCISTPPPPPMNDDPCGAIILSVNYGSSSFVGGYNNNTTASEVGQPGIPVPGCSSYLGGDVWYQATVPVSGRIIFEMASAGGPTDMGMAIYTSSTNNCNNINTLIECDDDDSQDGAMPMICRAGAICTVPGDCQQNAAAPPGSIVYIRVWEYGNDLLGPFDITAYEPAAPGAPSDCAAATVIPSLPYLENGQTTCCRQNTYDASDGCGSLYQDGEDYIYEYTPTVDQSIDITLTGTGSYTGVFVTDKCPSSGGVNCIASQTESGGNPMLCSVNLSAGKTYYIMVDTDPGPTCTPFNIRVNEGIALVCGLNYSVSSCAYNWENFFGNNIVLPVDDRFSAVAITIPFMFCYDGVQFNQLLVSSNGYVIFDPMGCTTNLPTTNAAPNTSSGWSIDYSIPNTNQAPRNCIMGPWHDIDPAVGGVITYSGALGTAPNRHFIVSWSNANMFSCTTQESTQQIKLFETSYDIEVHIDEKSLCASWNEGAAILGLHNYNGTIAVTEYNYPTQWTANNEAWRFSCGCVGCITLPVLPVELVNFTAKCNDYENILEWTTASETNNDYFTIEKSEYGINFYELDIIEGNETKNELTTYKYIDRVSGDYYYRLKQTDFDGTEEIHNTIYADCEQEREIILYPNPVKCNAKITILGEYGTISITDILGRKININITDNIIQGLPCGIYIVIIDGQYRTKLIIE